MTRTVWVDATGGISGDMLLGACLDAGVELDVLRRALASLGLPETITVDVEHTRRAGLHAARAIVEVPGSHHHRTLVDVLEVTGRLDEPVRSRVALVFRALARAEARVHGVAVDDVHFHEVGALDSIADVVGVVAGLHALGAVRLVCSPIALGGGRANTEHGPIPVPGPAVVELLRARGAPGFGGPVATELATPTGVALMTALADDFGDLPLLRPELVGVGAGGRDPDGHANVTRLVVGTADVDGAAALAPVETAFVLEANVDDLDPRLWPAVLTDLLAAGAADAWLTPIVMKKGRPAHTLSVLSAPGDVRALQRLVVTRTSTIGLRVRPVDKLVLAREIVTVDVLGAPVRVKLARLDGRVVNAMPEFDDVARVAAERDVPTKTVLELSRAAASAFLRS